MSNVYFKAIDSYQKTDEIKHSARALLEKVIAAENIQLQNDLAVKVHFGEKGNVTYIAPKNYEGIFAYLEEKQIRATYIETNAVYSGQRMKRAMHEALAIEHGFTQLPIEIIDGERGHEFSEVPIDGVYFKKCKIAKGLDNKRQMLVLSHFKGHRLAGYGGALKQLAMGCASRGGKLEQHADSKPLIIPFRCKQCGACQKHCPVDAIRIGWWSRIDKNKCIGCASCIAVCPYSAILFNVFKLTLSKKFRAKMAEYAYAAQKERECIYINFAFNLTKGCDCEGRQMELVAKDFGVLASRDPVAIDAACMDIVNRNEGRTVFKGADIIDAAHKLGIGSKQYTLVEM